ncbi:MAG: hypothetical protein JWO82_276, partial [Akkermansiaceae bacterium]|nr:hypothetical protein [Akkermansiaceae bacterium]
STSSVVHTKWGVVEGFTRSIAPTGKRYQAGYIQGANAGGINISAPSMALDGNLVATSIVGPNQSRPTPTTSNLPAAGSLTLKFQAQLLSNNAILTYYPGHPDITFGSAPAQEEPAAFAVDENGEPLALSQDRQSKVFLSPDLVASSGFGNLTIENAEGNILIPESTTLTTRAGSNLSLTAANISVLGDIIAPSSTITFKALNLSPYKADLLPSDAAIHAANAWNGIFTLGANATIDTTGLIIDDRAGSMTANSLPAKPNGGKVSITGYDVNLEQGSLIDVSGGYIMQSTGKGQFGNAGSISIKAGQDATVGAVLGGSLNLGSTLRGYSGAAGGSLSVQAQHVQIGGQTPADGVLLLQPEFFNQGGFSSFTIAGLGGGATSAVSVADGTLLAPVVKSYAVVPNPEGGGPLRLEVIEDVVGVRKPVSLTLSAPGVRDLSGNALVARGDVVIGEGSVIRTDPGGSVAITGNTVSVLGSIITPGGSISVSGGTSSALVFNDATQALATTYLGSRAVLSAAGTTVFLPDAYGRRVGSVLAGGNISIGGNIAAAAGAIIDVSGTSGVLDLDPQTVAPVRGAIVSPGSGVTGPLQSIAFVPTRIDSNAGTITLKGGQMLFSDATLLANAGGPTALGGTLAVSSGRFDPPGIIPPASAITLTVKQSGSAMSSTPGIGASLGNGGHFSVDSFANGGFDSLTLGGNVSFDGAVSIDARSALRVATDGFLYANSQVNLSASYVALGKPFQLPTLPTEVTSPFGTAPFTPTHGSGNVNITADQIDIGTISFQNIGAVSLTADHGDIRGSGTLQIAGDLNLRAGQIYPVTASSLSLISYDHQDGGATKPGTISIQASGTRQLPLSAGGTLGIYASVIHQDGTLRAPFGTIQLGWDGTGTAPVDIVAGTSKPFPVTSQLTLGAGSVTSVSAVDPITGKGITIPYGVSTNGENWIDPRGIDITTGGLPEKSVVLSAGSVTTEAGSSIDLRGGGDLYAYRFVPGLGGPSDVLASGNSFAVLPDYQSNYAPVSDFNNSTSAANLISGSGNGYSNPSLQPGDRVYLAGSATLPAGYYTLLPARYALLPGAVLVTPSSGNGLGTVEMPDKSSVVAGYRFNSLNDERTVPTLSTRFEIASSAVVRKRADYENYLANTFLKKSAEAANALVPRLPTDSGHLVFQATQAMDLLGGVASNSISGGRGSSIDISTPLDTFISSGTQTVPAGAISLSAAALNSFGAESLLIGGRRTTTADGVTVSVRSQSVTVDNAGSPLSAADVILAANGDVTLAPGASIIATGTLATSDTLHLTGNGALMRVSSDKNAAIVRTGATTTTSPLVQIGANATLQGQGLVVDSTSLISLDPAANLLAKSYSLSSGKISLVLGSAAAPGSGGGLILTNSVLDDLGASASLSLLSYSSIDILGDGTFGNAALAKLALSAGEIHGSGNATITAGELLLQNTANVAAVTPGAIGTGSLTVQAGLIRLGANQLAIDGYQGVQLTGTKGIIGEGTGGFSTQGSLTLTAPRLLGAAGAKRTITSGGTLNLVASSKTGALASGGLGSSLTLSGASVNVGTDIVLPSGSLSVRATTGDVVVNGVLDASGTRQLFHDTTKYTSAGTIQLAADQGSVVLNAGSTVNLSAQAGGGNAGKLSVSVPQGSFISSGVISGKGGSGGSNGQFNLDVSSLQSLAALSSALTAANLTSSQSIRVRQGDVVIDGISRAHDFTLSADQGSITVTGTIDASGATGGSIDLAANRDVITTDGSRLTVKGQDFSSAGKGGSITLEAGSQRNGVVGDGSVDIRSGSVLDLSVASKVAGDAVTRGSSAYQGEFSGKLHLRAPRISGGTDVAVKSINGSIVDASSILVEGYQLYDLTPSGSATNAEITTAVQNSIKSDATAFLGAAGSTTANYSAMMNRLLANNAGLESLLVLAPGAEIINRTGDLSLGTASSTTANDWDLSGFRFGAKSAPGVLTLRAAGNLVFNSALSDGFTPTLPNTNASWLWTARLTNQSTTLPVNSQSWSYRLTAGADLSSTDSGSVTPLDALGADSGSLKLGRATTNTGTTTLAALTNRLQFIRTGSGDIEVNTGRSVQLLNQFATIYTAGTRVANPTLDTTFFLPRLYQTIDNIPSILGTVQQVYPAQYSMAGGDVSIFAGQNIEHLTLTAGKWVADSQLQMPTNWLYRRGYVDGTTFGNSQYGEVASTTWWVDFSNFFEGIGTLGGGDVTLVAGNNISNVDAVAATNARMSAGTPNRANLLELGGGDVTVIAGNNIDAGVYYVERGAGQLTAGGSIVTNATRSVLTQSNLDAGNASAQTQLPTTLFLGKGSFDVDASGDVLLGPVANPFLLPGGYNNTYYYKSYFSTYATDNQVSISSLGGDVTLRESVTGPATDTLSTAVPILSEWYRNKLLLSTTSASSNRPWLRLNETDVSPFSTLFSLLPASLDVASFSGDISLAGNLTLSPSPNGTLSLLAQGAINGLQANGRVINKSVVTQTWGTSQIIVSDADPAAIPSVASPFAYQSVAPGSATTDTSLNFLDPIDQLFDESGGTLGESSVLQKKQALHAAGILHRDDLVPNRIYSGDGDISGLTLFSPKAARILAGRDISDIAFYIQNVRASDASIVASGRDIIPSNANSPLRIASQAAGNGVNLDSGPLAGDIQVSGPGSLQVLAGRNLDLGTGAGNADGTGTGITSIGNARNPFLPFEGADLVVGAGIGASDGLSTSDLKIAAFITAYVLTPDGEKYLKEIAPGVVFSDQTAEEQSRLALEVFYRILRDAGRGHAEAGNYDSALAAIKVLFGSEGTWQGNLLARSRDIRTTNGGDISILTPGGGVQLASTVIGNPLSPPGIITGGGGNISIFANNNIDIGIGRIFTLRGGNEIIWSTKGDIAAGSSSKTVQSAPPTRVLIDPQSGAVQTDLSGLATGGGIGVLATVKGVEPGNVDLIAPEGTVDAGDAGIRVSGNLNIAAAQVLNSANISVGGSSAGTPPSPAAPSVSVVNNAANTAAAAEAVAKQEEAPKEQNLVPEIESPDSVITVEVVGYGGDNEDEDDKNKDKQQQQEDPSGATGN